MPRPCMNPELPRVKGYFSPRANADDHRSECRWAAALPSAPVWEVCVCVCACVRPMDDEVMITHAGGLKPFFLLHA